MDLTLHRRIRSDIADRILSGEWSPGFRIPFEHELMADYDCSRMTVSKALAPLAERGMIVRRKRFGSFVARPRIHSVLLDIPDIQAEIQKRGEPYDYELLLRKVRAAHRRDASELGSDRVRRGERAALPAQGERPRVRPGGAGDLPHLGPSGQGCGVRRDSPWDLAA